MNKNIKIYLILGILTCNLSLVTCHCYGWGGGVTAGAGLEFEYLAGARTGAMGEIGSALENDISLLPYNPAGLANLTESQVGFDYMLGFGDLSFCRFVYNLPTDIGSFAVSLSSFDAGSAELNFADGTVRVIKAQTDVVFTFSYAKEFFKGIPIGFSGKVISSSLAERSAVQAFAIDAGGLFRVPVEGLRVGVCLQNMGGGLNYLTQAEPLPATLRAGLSYELLEFGMIGGLEFKWLLNEGKIIPSLGGEYKFSENLAFRFGYIFGNTEGMTFGLGFNIKRYTFDYAISLVKDIAPFGNQRLGFKMQL